MNILHTVESYDPSNHGMQQVVKQISERLVKLGHTVTIATSFHPERNNFIINGVKIIQFKISGKIVTGIKGNNEEIEAYRQFVTQSNFDIVTNFAAQQWATDLILPILGTINSIKIFVPTGFSELYNSKYYDYYESMKIWMKQYDVNIFLSQYYQDIIFAKNNGINNTIVIPNGASEIEFLSEIKTDIRTKLKIPKGNFLIIHVGNHTGLKGHKEAIKIFNKSNIKKSTLLIIGNSSVEHKTIRFYLKNLLKIIANSVSPFTQKHYFNDCSHSCEIKHFFHRYSISKYINRKQLVITTLSREETIDAYKEADLFLFPSNIECSPLVLFEAMASKTAILTSDVGNANEIISISNSGILLPTKEIHGSIKIVDIKKSIAILEKLFLNIDYLNEMKLNGFNVWKDKFSWEIIALQYEQLYINLIKKR